MNNNKVMTINEVSFRLKEIHDFEWLRNLGDLFCVFDEQDSGNICFGVEKAGMKRFVKYAGAKTIAYTGQVTDAVIRLKNSVPLYEELMYPTLVKLIEHYAISTGYVLIFEWAEGECLHSHWSFPPPEKYTHPDSPFYKFKALPIELRLKSLSCIFEFHVYVEKQKHVAIDFYDGSILYDFKNNHTKICDIDFYEKKPYINKMGRLWGSQRFMSPEEFELNAFIDGRTNVFNMGAIAFGLIGGELNRSFTKWDGNKALYEVALKAVDENRQDRFATVKEFLSAWEEAVNISSFATKLNLT